MRSKKAFPAETWPKLKLQKPVFDVPQVTTSDFGTPKAEWARLCHAPGQVPIPGFQFRKIPLKLLRRGLQWFRLR